MIRVRDLSKRYPSGTVALDGVTLDVGAGEFVALIGSSGAGKSTFLRCLNGLVTPTAGLVSVDGRPVTGASRNDLRSLRASVGFVFQQFNLLKRLSVLDNVLVGTLSRVDMGRTLLGRFPGKELERARCTLRRVGLAGLDDRRADTLSGGQQQRVAIARALAYEPEVLLFDEPFGALDAQIRTRLRREIRGLLKQIKVPAVFITHDQEEALELGDRIAVLNAGRLEQIGTPFEVYNQPLTEHVATFLGAANILEGIIRERHFVTDNVSLPIDNDLAFNNDQRVKMVFRPEDVFLRRPENLTQKYQKLTDGTVEEVSFVGAFERVSVRVDLPGRETIIVSRPKTETTAFPLKAGMTVPVGLVRFRILGEPRKVSGKAA